MTDCDNSCGKTILLVDDEPTVLKMASRMLQRLGYSVIATGSPHEALRLSRESNRTIEFVLSDVLMPGMNGVELVRQLLALRPALKVILMSGYTAEITLNKLLDHVNVAFIEKPFSRDQLVIKLDEVSKNSP
jgi:two-component system, cell cycle sensor histidine kinase and response regulator CckA